MCNIDLITIHKEHIEATSKLIYKGVCLSMVTVGSRHFFGYYDDNQNCITIPELEYPEIPCISSTRISINGVFMMSHLEIGNVHLAIYKLDGTPCIVLFLDKDIIDGNVETYRKIPLSEGEYL